MKKLSAVVATVAAWMSVAALPASAQEKTHTKVGAWTIIAVFNQPDGSLNRCLADLRTPAGMLRIHLAPNNPEWALSVPSLGLPAGAKIPADFKMGKTASPNVMMNIDKAGGRASTPLSPRWVSTIKDGGLLDIKMNKKVLSWNLKDTRAALASVEECVSKNKRRK